MPAACTQAILVRNSATADPFGTQGLRARVLDAWRASPARFREDANLEEDFAIGGYRDRLFVELLQNAADAARGANGPGLVRVIVDDEQIVVANTGQPLSAEGVQSLASVRASAKRGDDSVGRFGVGFAAVLAVTDEPRVLSRMGGVAFSALRSAGLLADEDALREEVQRRRGQVPVLRLPFADHEPPPDGYDTAVVLPLRDDAARNATRDLLTSIDEALLLGLGSLNEVVIEVAGQERRSLMANRRGPFIMTRRDDEQTRWRVVSADGQLPVGLVSDRPTEERERTGWSVTWAVPTDHEGWPRRLLPHLDSVVRTPTPTTEQLSFDAVLIATFPMDASRHHVEASAVTDFLVGRAAAAYADLVRELAQDVGAVALDLVPRPALVGSIDSQLREAVLSELATASLALSANGERRLAAARAVVLQPSTPELVSVFADVVDGLVAHEWSRSGALVDLLGAKPLALADALDRLVEVVQPAAWWRRLYDALVDVDSSSLDGLPVPLVDGRVVRGVRACVLPEGDPAPLAELGLRVVHPDAVHPLLSRLGGRPGNAAAILSSSELQGRLREELPPDEQQQLTRAVLALVATSDEDLSDLPGLSELRIPCSGGWAAAGECVLPDSELAGAVRDDVLLASAEFVDEVGAEVLERIGALTQFRVATYHDVLLDEQSLTDLVSDGDHWAESVAALADVPDLDGGLATDLSIIRGIDLVRDDAWAEVRDMLTERDVRRAIVEPVVVLLGDGRTVRAQSVAGWWLGEAPLFAGRAPHECRTGDDVRLAGVLEPVSHWADDPALLAAVGVAMSVEQLLGKPGGSDELLDRLGSADAHPSPESLAAIYLAIAALDERLWPDPPDHLRVCQGDSTQVVPADQVTVVVAPHHAGLTAGPMIAGPAQLAEVLDIASSDDLADASVADEGVVREIPEAVAKLVDGPGSYREHDDVTVNGVSVPWWVERSGTVHASTMHGLARGLAWSSGQWSRRWEFEALFTDGSRVSEAIDERAFDDVGW